MSIALSGADNAPSTTNPAPIPCGTEVDLTIGGVNLGTPAKTYALTATATLVGDAVLDNNSAAAATFNSPDNAITVTSTGDSGAGSLRQALELTNLASVPITVRFNIVAHAA
ncbi:MAG: hypothetical protein R3F11_20365 [Verrucomicrobiales bacterium]